MVNELQTVTCLRVYDKMKLRKGCWVDAILYDDIYEDNTQGAMLVRCDLEGEIVIIINRKHEKRFEEGASYMLDRLVESSHTGKIFGQIQTFEMRDDGYFSKIPDQKSSLYRPRRCTPLSELLGTSPDRWSSLLYSEVDFVGMVENVSEKSIWISDPFSTVMEVSLPKDDLNTALVLPVLEKGMIIGFWNVGFEYDHNRSFHRNFALMPATKIETRPQDVDFFYRQFVKVTVNQRNWKEKLKSRCGVGIKETRGLFIQKHNGEDLKLPFHQTTKDKFINRKVFAYDERKIDIEGVVATFCSEIEADTIIHPFMSRETLPTVSRTLACWERWLKEGEPHECKPLCKPMIIPRKGVLRGWKGHVFIRDSEIKTILTRDLELVVVPEDSTEMKTVWIWDEGFAIKEFACRLNMVITANQPNGLFIDAISQMNIISMKFLWDIYGLGVDEAMSKHKMGPGDIIAIFDMNKQHFNDSPQNDETVTTGNCDGNSSTSVPSSPMSAGPSAGCALPIIEVKKRRRLMPPKFSLGIPATMAPNSPDQGHLELGDPSNSLSEFNEGPLVDVCRNEIHIRKVVASLLVNLFTNLEMVVQGFVDYKSSLTASGLARCGTLMHHKEPIFAMGVIQTKSSDDHRSEYKRLSSEVISFLRKCGINAIPSPQKDGMNFWSAKGSNENRIVVKIKKDTNIISEVDKMNEAEHGTTTTNVMEDLFIGNLKIKILDDLIGCIMGNKMLKSCFMQPAIGIICHSSGLNEGCPCRELKNDGKADRFSKTNEITGNIPILFKCSGTKYVASQLLVWNTGPRFRMVPEIRLVQDEDYKDLDLDMECKNRDELVWNSLVKQNVYCYSCLCTKLQGVELLKLAMKGMLLKNSLHCEICKGKNDRRVYILEKRLQNTN